jgi:hypothetical protein
MNNQNAKGHPMTRVMTLTSQSTHARSAAPMDPSTRYWKG